MQKRELFRKINKKELEKENSHGGSRELNDFKMYVGALLPWHKLRVEAFLGSLLSSDVATGISRVKKDGSIY